MNDQELKENIKVQIVKYLNIMDKKPDQITDTMPLFGKDGLGLDSIDSLELVVMLEREFDIKLTNPTEARKILLDVQSIADYIKTTKNS